MLEFTSEPREKIDTYSLTPAELLMYLSEQERARGRNAVLEGKLAIAPKRIEEIGEERIAEIAKYLELRSEVDYHLAGLTEILPGGFNPLKKKLELIELQQLKKKMGLPLEGIDWTTKQNP